MYKKELKGLGCISAKIVADSVCNLSGTRITTFELEYPRFIHSELMTHRLFSRNAASSRAIPVEKMIEQVLKNYAQPIHWGANQAGMQAKEELNPEAREIVQDVWQSAAYDAARHAKRIHSYGGHKQIANRVLEPFQIMKTVVTATEWNNFWHLRDHKDAQPEIANLAKTMAECYTANTPITLASSEWHTPYFGDGYWLNDFDTSLADALAISSSCCAQVSFRLLDNSLEKAQNIYKRLVESRPVHASPFEHQATPFGDYSYDMDFEEPSLTNAPEGVTHEDKEGFVWSGNLKNWCQHRQLIKNNVVKG